MFAWKTTRIFAELLANYLFFRVNYLFYLQLLIFTTIPDSLKLSENYPRTIQNWTKLSDVGGQLVVKTANKP